MKPARFASALAFLAPAALALAACGGGSGGRAEESADDRVMGDPDAPVQIIEYASITCSACKAWHDQVWEDFRTQLIDTGQVRFVFREFPTAPQDVSVAGFLVARCAPEERYFNVLDTLFDRQSQLFSNARAELLAIARGAGMSEEQFNACIRNEDLIQAMNDRIEEGQRRFGVSSTPTFIINGEAIVGAQPLDVFLERVAEITGQPAPAPADGEDTQETPAEG